MTTVTSAATALVSVSDKRGMVEFCRGLCELNIAILSTGGSARELRAHGVAVTEVSEYTGFDEIMDGRVKTLHPKIHAGILARRGRDDVVIKKLRITPIDLVMVNLYPFARTVAQPDCDLERALENIDIGGPAMLRAAAKNHRDVTVLTDAADYDAVLRELRNKKNVSAAMRFALARKAFSHTAAYDAAIANYLGARDEEGGHDGETFPRELHLHFTKKQTLRYGENPHQAAALYARAGDDVGDAAGGITAAAQVQGKELSFNNIADADAAFACAMQFNSGESDGGDGGGDGDENDHACVIVKHANPCGVALAANQTRAYERAFAADAEAAFGGVIAFNRALDEDAARALVARQFAEVVIAPAITTAARRALAEKPGIRALECAAPQTQLDYKSASGGLLAQHADVALTGEMKVVSARAPDAAQMADLLFAWRVAKFVKSNAIVYAAARASVGIGAGQMSRVNSARLAEMGAQRADLKLRGAAMASDAFFPFRDAIDAAAAAGISAVIQPGGSRRDDEVIAAADEHDIAMVFTGMRHFRH